MESLSVALASILTALCWSLGEKQTGLWPDMIQLNALPEATCSACGLAAVLTAMLSVYWEVGGQRNA